MDDLITFIGKQLNIPQRTDIEWSCQVIYSVAGRMALASLWDCPEHECSISIDHFKQKIVQIYEAYTDIDPQAKLLISANKSIWADETYDIYRRTGHLYHSSLHVSPAMPAIAGLGNTMLHRGISPDSKLFMSGLGYYSVHHEVQGSSIETMFGLQTQPMEEYLQELLNYGAWEQAVLPDSTQFLRLEPPFTHGYWQPVPAYNNEVGLARYGEPNKIYVFYRRYGNQFEYKTIPEWRTRDFRDDGRDLHGEYLRIAIALLNRYNMLPEIRVKKIESQVEIKLGYRLPPAEEDLFKLYSWPIAYNVASSSVFNRKMAIQVYPLFKTLLENIGYHFVEE
jgi:hypothetical protein